MPAPPHARLVLGPWRHASVRRSVPPRTSGLADRGGLRLGPTLLIDDELSPGLRAKRHAAATHGLDPEHRGYMCKPTRLIDETAVSLRGVQKR